MRDFLFAHALWFELGTCGSLVLHSTIAPWQLLVFTSDNFEVFKTGAVGIGGGIVLIGPVRDFIFGHTRVWTGDLSISSPALYHCTMAHCGFHLWQFGVFHSGAEGLVVVLFWLDLWEIFVLPTLGFEVGTSGSLVLHSTYCTMATCGFQLWQFEVFNSGAEGLVVSLCWFYLWEIFFWPALEFELCNSGFLGIKDRCSRVGGGIVLIGPVRDFSFCLQWDLNWGPVDL